MNIRPIPSRSFPDNFVTHLQTLARIRPADTALIVVSADGDKFADKQFDYASLDIKVRAFAAILQGRFKQGERALLLMDNDENYVIGFFACLYAGIIAVPVFPPESMRKQHLARLRAIAIDAKAQCIITTSKILPLINDGAVAQITDIDVLTVDTIKKSNASKWQACLPQGDDIAFLQYTSGSTSSPKGVMVSHHNLMVNARSFEEGMSIGEDDIFVSWLPLYHDMGLIGGLLQPIHRGIPAILMTPKFFIEKPVRWFEVISHYRATVSGAPNFAFQLCVDRVKNSQLTEVDLSTWRVAFSGAELVRRDTMLAFIEHFQPVGFSAGTIYPCYGLAEATLFVTGVVRGEGMEAHEFSPELLAQGKAEIVADGIPIVACGFPASNHLVRIVDPEKLTLLDEGYVGEVWADGFSLANGYWQRSQENADTFLFQDETRWLRTGDLGFIFARQLYLMGRLKDLIIIRGQNIYPQDIEQVVEEEVEAARAGRVIAFSVEYNEVEGIGIAIEVSRNMQKRIAAENLVTVLSDAVSVSCYESLSVVVLLNPGALPKTSSGKLQRAACRQGWQERTLDAYAVYEFGHFVHGGGNSHTQALTDNTEIVLAAIWEATLNRTGLQREDHFFAIGGNSLTVVQVVARISDHWHIPFTPRSLFRYPRLHACASEIKRLLAMRSSESLVENCIQPVRDTVNVLPLSYGQQRLWFLWQLDNTSTAYHIQHALQLSGLLNKQAFHESFADLIKRHESLRTVFCINAVGVVEQVIQPASPLVITDIDLIDLPASLREERIAEEVQRIISVPFDLTQGPLLRVGLIRLAEQENVIVIVMHHIISDGVSMQILLNEFAAYYQAHVHEKPVCLESLPIRYADYAVWQRQWFDACKKEKQLAYWLGYLGEVDPVLALPTDRIRKPVTSYPAARYRFDLPQIELKKLRQLALDRGATVFMILMAAFQVLLFRHTGQQTIRVGIPIANRNRTETAGIIGFFVNSQVLQGKLHNRMLLSEFLNQVREDAINAQDHQDIPFEQLVEALQPQRDLRHSPLFQVTLNHLQKDYHIVQQFSGLTVTDFPLPEQAGQLELRLETVELPDGSISASLIYASDLFDLTSIERLARHYLRILHTLAAREAIAIGDIDLLDETDKRTLKTWGSNDCDAPTTQPVHQLIESQAANNPQKTAIISGNIEMSYESLNQRANRLAHRLISQGIKPEMCVGIVAERSSIELVVGLLAILKAGAGYLPLDPEYPKERLNYIIEDSGIALLLTQAHFKAKLPCRKKLEILILDSSDSSGGGETNPNIILHDDNLAYVIYTSGSTGRPKGVSVTHGPLVKHLAAIKRIYNTQPDDRELMFFSINFDAAAEQWIAPLTEGATLVLSAINHLAAEAFVELIEQHRITTLHLTPVYLRLLLPLMDRTCQSVRTCIAGGEAWYVTDVIAARSIFKHARLVNAYGPTETIITPTAWINHADEVDLIQVLDEFAPIGRPVGKRNLYVLDTELNLVPPGTAGELYIGGETLARGYLDSPALTSERFVADSFDQAGGRLYRTGDLVRWRNDGQLEYLSRLDYQIKLRGFRIELGEIEARLLSQLGVRDATVVTQEGDHGLSMIAYVVPHDSVQLNSSLLKVALADELPDYMIPSLFVFMDELPLNPNGKIDRNSLPAPKQIDILDYEPPVDVMEVAISDLWIETLGIPQVGLHNNFFDLGGHSLLLIQIKQKLEVHLNMQIALVDLFRYTTVASLAKFLSQGRTTNVALPCHRERAQRQRNAFIRQKKERTH